MKRIFLNYICLLLTFTHLSAYAGPIPGLETPAGPISSGGGKSIVCFDNQKNIIAVRLLDFYEAEKKFGNSFPPNEQRHFNEIVKSMLAKLNETGYGYRTFTEDHDPVSEGQRILRSFRLVPSQEMVVIDDSKEELTLQENCQMAQAASYLSDEDIRFDESIWNAMSEQDRAGLVIHEVVYWFERKLGLVEDSRRSRRTTAFLFDPQIELKNAFDRSQADTAKSYFCMGGGHPESGPMTAFDVYRLNGFLTFQFYWIGGEPVLTKTVAQLPQTEAPTSDSFTYQFLLHPAPNENVNLEFKMTRNLTTSSWTYQVKKERLSYPINSAVNTKLVCNEGVLF